MVTDHSSVGFEYLVLDRPLIVFDAPDLAARGADQSRESRASAQRRRRRRNGVGARRSGPARARRIPRTSPARRRVVAGDVLSIRATRRRARSHSSTGSVRAPRRAIPRAATPVHEAATESSHDGRSALDATVLIATYNRAALLDETLQSIRALRVDAGRTWEVMVVDNNSTDDTRAVVERQARDFPVPLRYLFEARQGRSSALNAGIAAACRHVIAMTDDDVRRGSGVAGRGVRRARRCRPVDRLRGRPGPTNLGNAAAAMAGSDPRRSLGHDRDPGSRRPARSSTRTAQGAARRQHGGAPRDVRTDRRFPRGPRTQQRPAGPRTGSARSCCCARGRRGFAASTSRRWRSTTIPGPSADARYFRSWWFGKGVSRAALERGQSVTDTGLDLTTVSRTAARPAADVRVGNSPHSPPGVVTRCGAEPRPRSDTR